MLAGAKGIGLWILPLAGGTMRRLADNAVAAAVSPDGRQIVFVSDDNAELGAMGADGGSRRRLAAAGSGYEFAMPTWSPDGRRVAYLKRSKVGDTFSIESLDVGSGQAGVILSDSRLRSFCWVRDGRIIYARMEPPPSETSSNLWEVQTGSRDGKAQGAPRRLTNWGGFLFGQLGITNDGRRLALVRTRYQSDVFVGKLESHAARLSTPRRLTLDDRMDWPGGWTRDGRNILFCSDRNGDLNLFKQAVDANTADTLLSGQEEQRMPRLSPDGTWILYLAWPRQEPLVGKGRLMRVPVSGGAPQAVLSVKGYPGSARTAWQANRFVDPGGHPAFRCSSTPAGSCVLSEQEERQVVFSSFDAAAGQRKELFRIDSDPSKWTFWDLSPDGREIAVSTRDGRQGLIRIVSLAGGTTRQIVVQGRTNLKNVAWAADGKSLFAVQWEATGELLMHLAFDGRSDLLYKHNSYLASPSPSPDGRYLAFGNVTPDANAWIIENFR